MGKNKYSDEELLIIKEYKEFANRIGKTPSQKEVKDERKFNNPNWIVTMHKINCYFNGLFELNEICNLKNYAKSKRKNKKTKTHEQFLKEVYEKVGDKYEFLTEYLGSEKQITIKCKLDGHTWTIKAGSFLKHGCKCPKCSNCVQNKDTDYFKKEIYNKYGNEYIVLGEYKTSKDKILIKHKTCGNEFPTTPDAILNKGTGCPICRHREGANKLFLSQKEFVARVYSIFGDEYTILGEYKGYKEYVLIKHSKCGREYLQQAGDILQGKGCRYCAGTLKKTQEKFEDELFNLYNGEYTVLGEYVNSKTPILIRHNKCSREYETLPLSILRNHGCNCKSISKGEYQIKNFLEFNKIKYKYQYSNKLCKFKNKLPFDFAVLDNNKNIICLIEYDGIQHFKPIECFGGQSAFEKTKIRDNIKNKYCEQYKIPLLRISYLNLDNINIILLKFLNSYLNNIALPIKDVIKFKWMDSNSLQLMKLLKNLPNGIYPKYWIKDKIGIELDGCELSRILKKDIIINFLKETNIIVDSESFIINYNYINYQKYLQLISNYNNHNRHTIIKIIRVLDKLPKGKHRKIDIKELKEINCNCRISTKYLTNIFMKKYLEDNNIKIENKFIIKE